MLDILLGNIKLYRKLTKDKWYYIRIKDDLGYGLYLWTRREINDKYPVYLLRIEDYKNNEFKDIGAYV